LFYTHQHIAYGGTFGQYYLEGPGAWLTTFAEYWSNTVILLVSYASCWRGADRLARRARRRGARPSGAASRGRGLRPRLLGRRARAARASLPRLKRARRAVRERRRAAFVDRGVSPASGC